MSAISPTPTRGIISPTPVRGGKVGHCLQCRAHGSLKGLPPDLVPAAKLDELRQRCHVLCHKCYTYIGRLFGSFPVRGKYIDKSQAPDDELTPQQRTMLALAHRVAGMLGLTVPLVNHDHRERHARFVAASGPHVHVARRRKRGSSGASGAKRRSSSSGGDKQAAPVVATPPLRCVLMVPVADDTVGSTAFAAQRAAAQQHWTPPAVVPLAATAPAAAATTATTPYRAMAPHSSTQSPLAIAAAAAAAVALGTAAAGRVRWDTGRADDVAMAPLPRALVTAASVGTGWVDDVAMAPLPRAPATAASVGTGCTGWLGGVAMPPLRREPVPNASVVASASSAGGGTSTHNDAVRSAGHAPAQLWDDDDDVMMTSSGVPPPSSTDVVGTGGAGAGDSHSDVAARATARPGVTLVELNTKWDAVVERMPEDSHPTASAETTNRDSTHAGTHAGTHAMTRALV